jgi:hypothetical protein
MLGMRFQTRVLDPFYGRVLLEEARHRKGV